MANPSPESPQSAAPEARYAFPDRVEVVVPVAIRASLTYQLAPGMAVRTGDLVKVPLGPRSVIGCVWGKGDGSLPAGRLKAVSEVLDVQPVRANLRAFIEWVAEWTLSTPGMVLRMVLRDEDLMTDAAPIPAVELAGPPPERMTSERGKVIDIAASGGAFTRTGLARLAGVSVGVVEGLVKAGTLAPVLVAASDRGPDPDPAFNPPTLSAEQAGVAHDLRGQVEARAFSVTLLDGVTGSGKTEVYFEAVARALEAGRQVLILMPEIALTGAVLERFSARFGVAPGEWHSEVTPVRRGRVWRGVAKGEMKVVVGARSALYLPFADLGLIVVDEEHEGAYKQEDRVAYSARDMAVVRARFENAALVLASATPSVESMWNVRQGRYHHAILPGRYGVAALPDLAAIDLKAHPPERGRYLSPPLVAAVSDTLLAGGQSLLFLNRRGYAPLTLCRACGHRFECPSCSAWLVEHRFRRQLKCHHCGHQEPVPECCPACGAGAQELVACGPGVERIHEEALSRWPDARTLVLSSDLGGGIKRLRAEIEAIQRGEVDIIIGTQLVAKGHNFPGLTLVGVVDADVGLAMADPRAAERTYQLLAQVTGRAGRADKPGRGLVQTLIPEHPTLKAIIAQDRAAFYDAEFAARERGRMPPYARLAALIVHGADMARTHAYARRLFETRPIEPDLDVLGPAEAPIFQLRGRFRYRLILRGPHNKRPQQSLRAWLDRAGKPTGDLRVDVDIDPQSFF